MVYLLVAVILALRNCVVESRLVALSPLKCKGSLRGAGGEFVPTVYLSRGKLEIIENAGGSGLSSAVLCDVIPVPLLNSRGESLVSQLLKKTKKSTQFGFDPFSTDAILVNRDAGLYDNLPYCWRKDTNAKLELFNLVQKSKGASAEGNFLKAVDSILESRVTGIVIELRDQLTTDIVVLGGAVVFSRNAAADDWKLSISNTEIPTTSSKDDPAEVSEAMACIVECHMDELIAVSLLTGLPIFMPKSLFDSLAIDATLTNDDDSGGSSEMSICGPTFRTAADRQQWRESTRGGNQGGYVSEASPAWEIFDAKKFLNMSPVEKRATLRASGVTSLPRPRDGLDSLDRALLEKMDDAVRGEVLRLKGREEGPSIQSPRQAVLKSIGEALDMGDLDKAKSLREEFMSMTARIADPTQAAGSYDPYLDQDDWYMAERRRAMAPKK